jgi:hypothetical protein
MEVQKSLSFVLTPLVHAACFLDEVRALSAKNGHIFRITFKRCIQYSCQPELMLILLTFTGGALPHQGGDSLTWLTGYKVEQNP